MPDWDSLYARWRRLGLNLTAAPAPGPVDLKPLLLKTASQLSGDERLAVCVATWLARDHDLIDGRRLSELTRNSPRTVTSRLGVLLTLAADAPDGAGRVPQFVAALSHCRPQRPARALYDVIESKPTLRAIAGKNSLPLYRRWGLWHDDLTLKPEALFPMEYVLSVPELRLRALCGPSVETACLTQTLHRVTNARELSRILGVTYSAAHAAVERLVGRGLLLRERNGARQELRPSRLTLQAIKAWRVPSGRLPSRRQVVTSAAIFQLAAFYTAPF
jgi:hypothetical protein